MLRITWRRLSFETSRCLPLLHPEQVREGINAENLRGEGSAFDAPLSYGITPYIENNKHDKDANIPPAVGGPDVEIVSEIFIGRTILT